MSGFHVHCDLSAMFGTVTVLVQGCVAAINLTFWCFLALLLNRQLRAGRLHLSGMC